MLKVEGIDPARITCEVDQHGVCRVVLDGDCVIARLGDHGPWFDGRWMGDDFRRDTIAVMNACIDEWRASGGTRLWPEPLPEPVDCVCGTKALHGKKGPVVCDRKGCYFAANTVAEWNAIQDMLKKMKEATS